MQDTAQVSSGRSFFGSSGKWAGEQLLRALKNGEPFSPAALRTADTLRKDEWKQLDDVLVEEAVIRLRGVADLVSAGLTIPVKNAMGKTYLEWETVGDMNDAVVSLSGVDRSEDDRLDFNLAGVPLPVTHKDFNLNLRTLAASRERGEPLDTMQARIAGRKVAEMLEYMLFNGGKTFGGKTIYGYLTEPNVNTVDFTDNFAWNHASKTSATILADVQACIARLMADKFYGPYWMYVPATYSGVLDNDFKTTGDATLRQRIMMLDSMQKISVADQLPDGHVVIVQGTQDVVALVDGEPIQTVQWDIEGGFLLKFKAFCIQIPLVRSTASGLSGVAHLSQL